MSGTRTGNNIVQHFRTTIANQAPPANVLLDGELSIEQNDPMKIWIGVPVALDPTGRKLLYDRGAAAAAVVTHDATMTGTGQAGSPLSVVQATQAQRGGAEVATAAEVGAVAPLDTRMVSPLGLRSEMGLPALDLVTNAKQVVPAINELISDLAAVLGVLVFAGAYDAATSTGRYNGHGGIPAGTGPLPAAAAANNNAYVVVFTNGPGSVGNEPLEPLHVQDWLVSDGTTWIALHLHQTQILAANVGLAPTVNGWTNVQQAIEGIWAVASTALQDIYFVTPTFVGDALTVGTALEVNVLDAGAYPQMPRIVQNTRTDLPNTPPVAGSLLPGQFAIEMNNPTRLWVGVPAALDPAMQKLLYDSSAAGIPANYVLKAGDTMTGALALPELRVNAPAATWSLINMDRAASQGAQISGTTANVLRWAMNVADASPESTGNAGSNFGISRFDDGGNYLDAPLYIYRNNGIVGFTQVPWVGNASLDTRYVLKTGDTMSGKLTVPYLDVFDPGAMWGAGGVIRLGAWDQYNWTFATDTAGNLLFGYVGAGAWITAAMWGAAGVYLDVPGRIYGHQGVGFNGDNTMIAYESGGLRVFQWAAGGWYDAWQTADGLRTWNSYAGLIASLSGTGVFRAVTGVQANIDGSLAFFQDPGGIARHYQYTNGWEHYWDIATGNWVFFANGQGHFVINSQNGVCYDYKGAFAGMGAYVDMSDDAIKTNVAPATVGLAEILALEPISFTRIRIDGPPLTTLEEGQEIYVPPEMGEMEPFAPEIGFSAQQVQSVIAAAVRSVGMKLPDGADILGVMTTPIVVGLVNAVKTLTARIEALEGAR